MLEFKIIKKGCDLEGNFDCLKNKLLRKCKLNQRKSNSILIKHFI